MSDTPTNTDIPRLLGRITNLAERIGEEYNKRPEALENSTLGDSLGSAVVEAGGYR